MRVRHQDNSTALLAAAHHGCAGQARAWPL